MYIEAAHDRWTERKQKIFVDLNFDPLSRTAEVPWMPERFNEQFDPIAFLSKAGIGRKALQLKAKAAIFSQGDNADAVFYIQRVLLQLSAWTRASETSL